MLKLFRKLSFGQPGKRTERGQSLVEMAVIVPLLAFMFLGLIEVGWAIRGYMVLLSTNREAVRFAARGEYLDFDGLIEGAVTPQEIENRVGYGFVKIHADEVLESNRLGLELFDDLGNPLLQPLDDASQGSFLMTHIFVDTALPCHPNDITANNSNGTCLQNLSDSCADMSARKPDYPYDDLILIPSMTGYDHFFYALPFSTTYTSRLDLAAEMQKLKEENDILNCEIQRREPGVTNPTFSVNSMIIGEAYYDQPQLLGVPLLANTFTDPIPLYVQTKMRITSDSLPQGGACEALPIVINEDSLYTDPPNNTIPKAVGTPIDDIREGGGSGGFGWLRWRNTPPEDPEMPNSTDNAVYLAAAITNPRYSIYDYINPNDPNDTVLNVNDYIWGSTGQVVSNEVTNSLNARINGIVTIPVWDTISGSGSNQMYHIVNFAFMRITNIDFQGNPKTISGVFMGWNNECFTTDVSSF